jgi:hypothetical protein
MSSKMRHGLLISFVVIGLFVMWFGSSHAETTTYVYDELNRLIQVIYEDGTGVIYTYDAAGNRIILSSYPDILPPTGTIIINSGDAYTTDPSVTLTLTCIDNVGCSQMQFSNDNVTYSTPEDFATTKPWTLSPGDGTKTVYAKFKDVTGHWSTACSDSIELSTLDSYTKSLLHMNGTDGSTTFTDNATGELHTWTAYGGAQIDTARSRFGGASGLFTSSGYISTPDSADWYFGTGDFTIDFWVRLSSLPGGGDFAPMWSQYINDNNFINLAYGWSPASWYFSYRLNGVYQINMVIADTLSINTWYHIAIVRTGNIFKLFKNGTQVGSNYSSSNALGDLASGVQIGRFRPTSPQYYLNGWLDEFRVSKGIARWTSNFTPPGQEYGSPPDTTPPTGTIIINSGDAVTYDLSVTLTLTCNDNVGCSQMQFSNDNVTYSTPEEFATTKLWTLLPGNGTKTVYAKFGDPAGNWSIPYSDTIDLILVYTKSLLHMNGTDGSTTFTDSATGEPHTWTAAGNAQIDTAQSKFGGASGLFDGNGDYIWSADSADWAFGDGNFTIDFWAKRTRSGTNEWIFGQGGSSLQQYWGMQWYNDNYVYCNFRKADGGTVQLKSTITISDTNWHHYAYVRDGNTLRLFIDGVARGTANVTGQSQIDNPYKFVIGRVGEYNGYYFAGWVDEFRISKGIARWTSNFTPPTEEYSP